MAALTRLNVTLYVHCLSCTSLQLWSLNPSPFLHIHSLSRLPQYFEGGGHT